MRFSPTRIVLAALAFIVGAVLALPMLLSRKVEAGDAPPKLEALKLETAQLRSASEDGWSIAASPLGSIDFGVACGEGRTGAWSHDLPWPHATGPSTCPDGLRAPMELLTLEFAAAPLARSWPAAQVIDRQRKYHLRP